MSRYKFLGINDEKSFCECCGKQGLKRVVWIEDTETNEIRHFGTTCAVQPVKGFHLDAQIKAEVKRQNEIEKSRMIRANIMYRQKGGKYVSVEGKSGTWTHQDKELWQQCVNNA